MAFDPSKPLKRVNGQIVPQVWDDHIEDWSILQGFGGAYRVQNAIDVAEDYFEGSGNLTKEFANEMIGLVISNDSEPGTSGSANLTFTIHGVTRTVKAGEVYEGKFKPFTSVTVNSAVPWRAETLQSYYGASSEVQPPADTTAPDNATGLATSNVTATTLLLTWSASASSDCVGYDIYRGTALIGSVTATTLTYNVTGLSQNTQYTFTIKAKDAANNISSGTSTTITTAASADTDPPANVTGLTYSNVTQSSLTLNWSASVSSDVASYDIFNGTTFLANVTSTTYNVNGLTAGTAYSFVVKSKDSSGNSASGTSVNVTTAAAIPAAPTGLSITPGDGQVTLSWTAVSGATSYNVYRNGTKIASPTGTSYTDTGLTNGTSYSYSVSAVNTSGESSQSTAQTATPVASADTTAPDPVSNLIAGTVTTNSIPVSWALSNSSDVVNYEVAFSGNGGTSFTIASAVVNASSTSYEVTGLSSNKSYIIRVVAIDGAGNRSTAVTVTTITAAAEDSTPPEAVTNLTAGTPTANSVPLTFTASVAPDVSKYEVAFSTDGTNFTVATSTLTGTSYTVTGLNATTTYTFRVVAIDTSGNRSTVNPTVQTTTSAASGKVTSGLVREWDNQTAQTSFNNDGTYFPASGEFTVYAVLKPKAFMNILSQYNVSSASTSTVRIYVDSTAQKIIISSWGKKADGITGEFPSGTSSALLLDSSTYYHVVLLRDNAANKYKIYVNNVDTNTAAGFTSGFTLNPNVTPPAEVVKVGEVTSDMKYLLYYNRLLSSSELTQNFNNLL